MTSFRFARFRILSCHLPQSTVLWDRIAGNWLERLQTVTATEMLLSREPLAVGLFIHGVGRLRPHQGQNLHRQS